MAEAKKKRVVKTPTFKQFFSVNSNLMLVGSCLLIAGLTFYASAKDLSNQIYAFHCTALDIRPDNDIAWHHKLDRTFLWSAGILLILLIGLLIYRNKIAKRLLVSGLVVFILFFLYIQFGLAWDKGFSCLNW